MPKKGYESVTIKTRTLETLQGIGEQINKTVPDTIAVLANLFSRYIGFLKALEGQSPPTTEDMLAIIETIKIQTAGEPSRVEAQNIEAEKVGS